MTDKLQTVILEAVDCLRQRKCRPDRESIAVYVMRKLGSSMNEIFSEIENIVDQGDLLKVEYKGTTSYRSPKSFDLKNSPLLTKHSKILNSSKTTRYVISGINELLSTFPNYSQEGVPYEELKKKLSGFDAERFAETSIKTIFEREEAAGNILPAQSNDPVYPTRIFPKDINVPEDMKIISFVEDTTPLPEPKKRKRPKKADGEEETASPSTSPTTTTPKKRKSRKQDNDTNGIVYAVKSDPNKFNAVGSSVDNDSVKAKAEQTISSIGLKVMARKTGKGQKEQPAEPIVDEIIDRKPSLALVKHEVEEPNESMSNGVTKAVKKVEAKSVTPKTAKVEAKPATPKTVKKTLKKNAPLTSSRKRTPVETKVKMDDSDSDDQLTLSHVPPRYTYSAKKRCKRSYFDEVREPQEIIADDANNGEMDRTKDESFNGHTNVCAYCRQVKNSDGQPEDFLSCGTCNAKIHPTCIDYSEDHAKRLRMNSKSSDSNQWQCFSCKRCGVCQNALMSSQADLNTDSNGQEKNSKKNEQRYVLCDQCDKGYHASCIDRDPSDSLNTDSWFCLDCENSCGKSVPKGSEKPQTVAKPHKKACYAPKDNCKEDNPKNNGRSVVVVKKEPGTDSQGDSESEEVPDISSWTPTQVQTYFIERGLHEEAASLREQEIDGMSLLLLRRADVIFGLNLRLGPALKIYRLVCQLQQNSAALKKKNGSGSSNRPTNTAVSKRAAY